MCSAGARFLSSVCMASLLVRWTSCSAGMIMFCITACCNWPGSFLSDHMQCLNSWFALRLPYFRMILWHEMQLEGRKCFLTAEAVWQNFITLMFWIVYDFSEWSNWETNKSFYWGSKIVVYKGEKCKLSVKHWEKISLHPVCSCPSALMNAELVDWAPTLTCNICSDFLFIFFSQLSSLSYCSTDFPLFLPQLLSNSCPASECCISWELGDH